MYKKVDKFDIFSKKFAKLDDEGQDSLVKAARQLLKTHQDVKNTPAALISKDDTNTSSGFNDETKHTGLVKKHNMSADLRKKKG